MIEAIKKEIHMRKEYLSNEVVESIYFGGGTPSLLNEQEINGIIEEIQLHFTISNRSEITLEANPDDLSKGYINSLSNTAINRLSIGVQSFHDDELKWMNRAHNSEEAENCIKSAQDAGLHNISMDLIFGIPASTHAKYEKNLHKTLLFDIPHISSYALTIEQGTALDHFVKVGKAKAAEDSWVMEQFDMTIDTLTVSGYEHYEISNYSKPDYHAIHNSNYWKSKSYLGIGPSAHSYDGNSRTSNVAHNAKYLEHLSKGKLALEIEMLDNTTKYNEYIMTRLRTKWGVKRAEISLIGDYFLRYFEDQLGDLIKKGWIEDQEGIVILSRKGKHFADAAAMELFYAS